MEELLSISPEQWTKYVSYLASIFVLGSFLMKDVRKLRLLNSLGCLFFIYYGIRLNNDFAIIATNLGILSLNIYYLFIRKEN